MVVHIIHTVKEGNEELIEQGEVLIERINYVGKYRGTGEVFNSITPKGDWIVFQPHDVFYKLEELLDAIKQNRSEHFQLSLSDTSYGSHYFTWKAGRTGWHYVPFVEILFPVFSRKFWDICQPYMWESKSGWGLDNIWSILYQKHYYSLPMICYDYTFDHVEPIKSQNWLIDGKTPHQELEYIKKKYNWPDWL